eukprot:scaffold75106_cov48-Phaeocystis_antarctica.AAC.1
MVCGVRGLLGGGGTGPLRAAAARVLRPRDDAPVRRVGRGVGRVVLVTDVEFRQRGRCRRRAALGRSLGAAAGHELEVRDGGGGVGSLDEVACDSDRDGAVAVDDAVRRAARHE